MKEKIFLAVAAMAFVSPVYAGQSFIKAPGVEIGSDYISAPGVEIRPGSIKAPGVDITTDEAESVYMNDDYTDKRITLKTAALHINGDNNRIFGKGSLKHLYIAGDNNIVDLENSILAVTFLGKENTVLLPENGKLQVSDLGDNNKVHYRKHTVFN